MVIPFSNTKLRVPKGFQSLLVGLSTEVLRSQPRNIHEFAADYFEKLVQRRDQGDAYVPDKQTSLEDRYYNNPSFQEEYSVNDPEVHHAATRIQAKFRGHKARQDVEKMRHEKDKIDTDREELGVHRQQSAASRDDDDHQQKSSRVSSARSDKQTHKHEPSPPISKHTTHTPAHEVEQEDNPYKVEKEPDQQFDMAITPEEREEQERAARSIQARFRGHRNKKGPGQERPTSGAPSDHEPHSDRTRPDSGNDHLASRPSTQEGGQSDRAHGGHSDHNTPREAGENHHHRHTDQASLKREPTQLSDDFERHTQVPHDADFERERPAFELKTRAPHGADLKSERPDFESDDIDMNDPHLDKAATRIQASFRGYKTRKELGTGGAPSTSAHGDDDHDHPHDKILPPPMGGHKEHDVDDDDNTAAIKIQAAYRGYRVRKDLEK